MIFLWYEQTISISITYLLENFYYISGIALFIVGIWQITSAVKLAQKKTEREAITFTSQLCDRFYKELIPQVDELDEIIEQYEFTFSKDVIEKNGDLFISKKDLLKYINLSTNEESMDAFKKFLYLANLYEAFSTYFVKGVADSKVGFEIIGKSYCHAIRSLVPILVVGSQDKRYPSIIQLYKSWNNKLIVEKTETDYLAAVKKDTDHFRPHGL